MWGFRAGLTGILRSTPWIVAILGGVGGSGLFVACGSGSSTLAAQLPRSPPLPDVAASGALRTPTGVVVPVLGHYNDGRGRWVRTPCFRITAMASGRVLTPAPDVVLDPGHGGAELGAVSSEGLTEASVNLAVAQLVERELEGLGYTVELTRSTDTWMTIRSRTEVVQALRPKVAVSIHHNAGGSGSSDQPGTEVFAQRGSAASAALARVLHERLSAGFAPLGTSGATTPTAVSGSPRHGTTPRRTASASSGSRRRFPRRLPKVPTSTLPTRPACVAATSAKQPKPGASPPP